VWQVAVLRGHSSHTKGVAWDPVGTYLASQSDDRTIIVWRCSDWTKVTQTGEPFSRVCSLYFPSPPARLPGPAIAP